MPGAASCGDADGSVTLGEPIGSASQATLADDGFLVVPAAIPRALADSVVAVLATLDGEPRPFADPRLRTFSTQLQFAPAVVAALHKAMGDEPRAMTCNYFMRSPGLADPDRSPLGPHTHDREIVTVPANRFLLCWTALQDIDLAQGPMWIAPGSHHRDLPLQTQLHRRIERGHPGEIARIRQTFEAGLAEGALGRTLETYHRELDRLLTGELGSVSPVLLSAGDSILFDPALVHGTLPPLLGPPRPRCSFLSRYTGLHSELFILPPWMEEAVPIERFRLPDRNRSGPAGIFYTDYIDARLSLLGVRRTNPLAA